VEPVGLELDQALEDSFSKMKVLIVDGNYTDRTALHQSLLSYGVLPENIFSATSIQFAGDRLKKTKVDVLISDFSLKDGLGSSFQTNSKSFSLVLLSSVISQAAVAKALEAEVDAFLFKPYFHSDLKKVLQNVIKLRMNPPKGLSELSEGKKWLAQGNFEQAKRIFEKLNQDPELSTKANAYMVEIRKIMTDSQDFTQVRRNLESTEVCLLSLLGMYHRFRNAGRLKSAYDVLSQILQYFPENPDRLIQAIDLAVRVQRFEDLEKFYEIYRAMFEKSEKLLRHMSSALLIYGHHLLKQGQKQEAMRQFLLGISVAQGHDQFTLYVREKLVQFGMESQIEGILQDLQIVREAG
jgi:tetratricopeptide (TPR) repeat protein